MEKKPERRGLGRGLSALMADINLGETGDSASQVKRPDLMLPIEDVIPNPNQPRRTFDAGALNDLAD